MREIQTVEHSVTKIFALDAPGAGGACHSYIVVLKNGSDKDLVDNDTRGTQRVAEINFQNGPVQEAGANGCFQEDLIAICVDRLRSFQQGDFKCRENALAITHLEEALNWLNSRTLNRKQRGVEGKLEV